MTNNQLEACLIEAVEKLSGCILLTGTKGERKSLKGYLGALPQLSLPEYWELEESESLGDSAVEDTLIPYCVVKTTEVEMKEDAAKAKVYLVFCLYAQDGGHQTLWNLLNCVTGYFRTHPVLDAFYCERAMKAIEQGEDTYPYFFGGIEMTWNLPELECEENYE